MHRGTEDRMQGNTFKTTEDKDRCSSAPQRTTDQDDETKSQFSLSN